MPSNQLKTACALELRRRSGAGGVGLNKHIASTIERIHQLGHLGYARLSHIESAGLLGFSWLCCVSESRLCGVRPPARTP